MRIFIFILFLIFGSGKINTQNDNCNSKLTEDEVIKIAKKKFAYRDKDEKPEIYFNKETCEWTVESMKRKEVTKHNMRHIKLTFLTLVIDAETKKVKSRERDVHYVPVGEP